MRRHRCSIFCSSGDTCISEALEKNHIQCLTDMIINRTQAMAGAIEMLLADKQECLEPDITEFLHMIRDDIRELSTFIERISRTQ